ncbi:MAG: stage II sporulation protein E, partial [Rikenellaceae bacterium]
KVLVCTGPPYNQADDPKFAQIVNDYDGDVILSGGTTASIIARELNREINVVLQKRNTGVPSKSEIKGISLVTEGVLTLGKVKERLMETKDGVFKGTSPDIEIIHSLLEHDIIEFVVGMKINTMHQNPNIPVELALRRNVVKDIAHELREKFMKEVTMKFI